MYDDFKDFLVLHYMGGRTDSKFWQHIATGETKTEFVDIILEMSKSKMPTANDFSQYYGAAGWPLWAWVLAGTKNLSPTVSKNELDWDVGTFGNYETAAAYELSIWKHKYTQYLEKNLSYNEFIEYLKING